MPQDIRPFEVQNYNPSIHELVDAEYIQPSFLRRAIAAGLVISAGFGIYNHAGVQESSELAPDSVVPELLAPEVATPEVAQINAALAEVKLGQQNNLDKLVEAVKMADAVFAPQDKDRLPEMPVGYVKFLLPHEAIGINVPYTVAERTADNERYTSPEMAAQLYATAKLYQDLIATKYPELNGEMLRVRDLNSKFHRGHKSGEADVAGAFGWGVTQYSSGALADQQFSERFRADFTVDMAVAIAGLMVHGKPVVREVVYGDQQINNAVNGRVGRHFMVYAKWHKDHLHQYSYSYLPAWSPSAEQSPWSENQDLHVGGMAQAITPEQHVSQHRDFEDWIAARQKYTDQMTVYKNQTAPEGFKVEPITHEAAAHIDRLDVSSDRKEFLKRMVPAIATVYKTGAKINPAVALTQTSLETGFGDDELSKDFNNYFGIKSGKYWNDKSVNLDTLEEYIPGNVEPIRDNFRVYPNPTSSVADYARLIQARSWYADAVINYQNIEGYLNGLFHEVDSNGTIVRRQGEPGVASYGTDTGYTEKALSMIRQYDYEGLMAAQLSGKA